MPLLGIAAIGAVVIYGLDKGGEGVNDAGTGALKIALAAGAVFIVAKQAKLI